MPETEISMAEQLGKDLVDNDSMKRWAGALATTGIAALVSTTVANHAISQETVETALNALSLISWASIVVGSLGWINYKNNANETAQTAINQNFKVEKTGFGGFKRRVRKPD